MKTSENNCDPVMAKHTPTPWSISYPNSHTWEMGKPATCEILGPDGIVAKVLGVCGQVQADSAFIVRAVNAHQALVLACINALGVCKDAGLDDSDPVVKQLMRAIANAEGRK